MTDPINEGMTHEELADQSSEQLPEREEMSLINANIAIPVNAAVAANVLSDGRRHRRRRAAGTHRSSHLRGTRCTENDDLQPEELAEQSSEQLPEREEMSLINANLAAPVNAAVAATSCRTTRLPTQTPSRTSTSPRPPRAGNPS